MKPRLCGLLGLVCLAGVPASADELRLKDGTKIAGRIVGYEDDSFKVATNFGYALVRRDKVASILLSNGSKSPPETKSLGPIAPPAAPPPAPAAPALPAVAPASPTLPPAAAAPAPPAAGLPAVREEVQGNFYTNHTYGFRLYKPPSWQVIEGTHRSLPNAVVAMGTSDETTLLIVGLEPLRGSLEMQVGATERQLREIYENYRVLEQERRVVGGVPAVAHRFRGTVEDRDWSGRIIWLARDGQLFTLLGMTYADSDLIQIQENVIAKTIASLEFAKEPAGPRTTPHAR